jgi:predicted RNA-binding Zn ribbon-like protein
VTKPRNTERPHARRQPGDRVPAPGALAVVQSFVNSRWDLERDHQEQLSSPAALARWLTEHKLFDPTARPTNADLRRALAVREGLRALLFANNGEPIERAAVESLNQALGAPALAVRLDSAGPPAFTAPRLDVGGALATIASIVATSQIEGTWPRFKACPGRGCGWAFYDHSRNQSGSWCSMSLCGSRAKAREYRRRHKQTS